MVLRLFGHRGGLTCAAFFLPFVMLLLLPHASSGVQHTRTATESFTGTRMCQIPHHVLRGGTRSPGEDPGGEICDEREPEDELSEMIETMGTVRQPSFDVARKGRHARE